MNNRHRVYWGWTIIGNEDHAFAQYQDDIHYFARDPDVNDDAFISALGWAHLNYPDFEGIHNS